MGFYANLYLKRMENFMMRKLIHRDCNGELIIPINETSPMEGKDFNVPGEAQNKVWNIGKWRRRHDCFGAIYAIIHEGTGLTYIGQTVSPIRDRVSSHISDAFNPSKRIYNSKFSQGLRRFGIENFSVWEVTRCYSQSDLDKAEKEYIKRYKTNGFGGFNVESGGKKGFFFTEDTRKKMSVSRIGDKNWRYGKPVSEETRRKIGVANSGDRSAWKGEKHTSEELRKISKSNREYYIKHPERAAAISARRKKRVICRDTGEVFDSLNAAARSIGVSNGSISSVCRGKHKTVKGFHFEYYKENEK